MKTKNIGLLVPHGFSYYRRVLRGIRRYAEMQPNWRFHNVELSGRRPEERLLRTLNGLIVAVNIPHLAQAVARLRKPVVSVSAVLLPRPARPWVGVHNGSVSQLAADHFLDRGLRNFGFVGTSRTLYSTERESAFGQALASREFRVASYHDDDWNFDPEGYHLPLAGRRIRRWLRSLPKPIGIFTPSDQWGMQLVNTCTETGLHVPDDVSVVGVDDDDLFCQLCRPLLSSVLVPAERIGQEAAALLDRLIDGANPPDQPLLLPSPGLVARGSSDILAIDDEVVIAAARFIREHKVGPLRVADVLRKVPMGRRSLERRFRKTLGRGLAQEIRQSQLAGAKRLLVETDLKMSTIAQRSGFCDYRHMALAFRRELGMSPSAYRQRERELGF